MVLNPDVGWIGDSGAVPCTGASGDRGAALPSGDIAVWVVLRQPVVKTNAAAANQNGKFPEAEANGIRWKRRVMEKSVR